MRRHHDGFGYTLTSAVVLVCFETCVSERLHTCAQLDVDLTAPLMSNLYHYICSCPPPFIHSLFIFFFSSSPICGVITSVYHSLMPFISTAPYFCSQQSCSVLLQIVVFEFLCFRCTVITDTLKACGCSARWCVSLRPVF